MPDAVADAAASGHREQTHDEEEFRGELMHARLQRNHAPELFVACYWMGFEWGVCRRFHSANFGTREQHEWRSALIHAPDLLRASMRRGYRDGLKG